MAIRRCPYCKAIIDESQKYCNNCGTQLLFPDDEPGEEPIKGEKIVDEDFPGDGSERGSNAFIDEPRDEEDEDVDAEEDREEIDLEKVIEGDVPLARNTAEDFGLVDLREAEPEPDPAAKESEEVSIEKPVTVEDALSPEIRVPESAEPEEADIPRSSRPLSRKKKAAPPAASAEAEIEMPAGKPVEIPKEKPLKLTPHRGGSASPKVRSDENTKFEIARLIADFERRRREYTADLEPPPAEAPRKEPVEEPVEPPTEVEIGEPPKPEELEKEADALRTGTEGDFATDYEFVVEEKKSETEKPGSLDERLSRLVGGFNVAVESGADVAEDVRSPDTRHPEFMTGELGEETEPKELPEEAQPASGQRPSFVTKDFEEEAGILPERDREVQAARREFLSENRREESAPVEPPPPAPGTADERSALIARILKQRADKFGRPEKSRVSRETSEALEALKSSNAVELAKTGESKESEELEEPREPEILKGPEEPGEFRAESWRTPSQDLPSVPTMGIPEALPKTAPPIPFEAPAEDIEEPPETPVSRPPGRRSEVKTAEPEAAPPAPISIEEPAVIEERPAPVPDKPAVRAPVVRLGFFRRIKATIFDLLVVGAFWAGATALTAHFLSIPVLDLISSSALPLGLLFVVLLAIYLFMFLLFLGETPGGRLAMPKN